MDVTLFPQEEVYKELYNNLEILPAPRTILEPMLDCIEEEMEDDLEEEELVFVSSNGNKKKKKKKKKGKKNANVTDFSIEIPSDLKMQPNTIVKEVDDHEEGEGSRQPRQLAVRSNSLKRRDASWDHKWMEHLERNTPPEGDTLPRSSVFSRSPRQPGKVDRQVWEHRAAEDEVERLKRRTFAVASPKPHHGASLKDFHSPSTTPVQAPPSPKPQVGQASIKDYSPTRTETPPYPTALNEVDDQQSQQQKPLPSPPISIQSPNYHQQQVDLPTPPPPLPPTEPDQAEGWKEEMREEIWRARHSLLTGQDSQGVKSVIRLLEQTYDRLQHDDNNEATLLMSTTTLPLNDDVLEQQPITNGVENLTEKEFPAQLSCVLDDDIEEQSQQQVIELSRSVSGTFHALPAEATYEDIEGNDNMPEVSPNLAQDRKEFCQTMLAQNNTDKVIEKVQQSKVTLMDEIHSKVQKIPAVDEVFKPNFIQLKDPLVDLLVLPIGTPNDIVQTKKEAKPSARTEEKSGAGETHISQNLVQSETKYVDESIQVITTKDENFDMLLSKEDIFVIDDENFNNNLGEKGELGEEVNSGGVDHRELSDNARSGKESTQSKSTSFKESINLFESKPKTQNTKWLQFETCPKREKVFSISGLWNKVSLGLVKERSTFWQGSQGEVFPFPSRQQQQQTANAKRSSRLIDPNEWMTEEVEGQVSEHQQQSLHKSVSMGQLDCQIEEEERDELLPVSQATVAFEARANGRKSADIFVQHSNPSEIIPEEQKECEEPVGTDNCEMANDNAKVSPTTHQQIKEETFEHVTQETSIQCYESRQMIETKETCSRDNFQSVASPRKDNLNPNPQTSQSLDEKEEVKISTQQQASGHAIEPNALPPQVPGRHSSKKVLREKMQQQQHHPKVSSSSLSPKPVLTILKVETSNSEEGQRARLLAQYEEEKQKKMEEERKVRQQCEQESIFYQKMETAERYRQHQSITSPSSTPTSNASETIPKKSISKETKRLERIKTQELKERMKLKEMERRKREIEEEIMKEKQHLAQLLQLEKLEPAISDLPPSPPPPPVPPRPRHCFSFDDEPMQSSLSKSEVEEEKEKKETSGNDHPMSFTETFEDLENTTQKLKEMAEKKAAEQLKETAGMVRDVAQVLLQAVDSSKAEEQLEEEEEDQMTEGFSEGAEDFSCGVELPFEQSSGNVTPIPTQGELEEIDTSNSCSPRRTPLKSLLKKGWENDETLSLPEDLPNTILSSSMRERSNSPRKAVHFSEVDQIKLMSQESLVSTAPSEQKNQDIVQSSPSQTCSASRMKAKEAPPPCRNQLVSS